MEKTAVEWLEYQLPQAFKDLTINKQLFKQAKEMEKQQIIDAFEGFPLNTRNSQNGQEYYNETFNK